MCLFLFYWVVQNYRLLFSPFLLLSEFWNIIAEINVDTVTLSIIITLFWFLDVKSFWNLNSIYFKFFLRKFGNDERLTTSVLGLSLSNDPLSLNKIIKTDFDSCNIPARLQFRRTVVYCSVEKISHHSKTMSS